MARQFTKILICTTHENDAKKYHSYLKKIDPFEQK